MLVLCIRLDLVEFGYMLDGGFCLRDGDLLCIENKNKRF